MITGQSKNAFYYSQLTWFHHPSYLAMYCTFAIAILASWLMEGYTFFNRLQLAGTIMLMTIFFVFILFLNSKSGLISLFMVIILYSILLGFHKRKWLIGAGTLLLSALLFFTCITLFPKLTERVKESEGELHTMNSPGKQLNSTGQRIAIWKCSSEIIREHALFGVGTGDVKDALLEKYKANNLTDILNKNLDVHNQYLQTFVTLGVFGLIALICLLVLPAVQAVHRKDFIFFMFLAVFGVNIMVESMLENQAGVVFYAVFNAVLYVSSGLDPSDNPYRIMLRRSW